MDIDEVYILDNDDEKSMLRDQHVAELREKSSQFTTSVLAARESVDSRRRPWFVSLPLRSILTAMHSTIANSCHMAPFQLIALGRTLTSFVLKLKQCQDRDFIKYLKLLENLFQRLAKYCDENADEDAEEVKIWLDSVWEMHTSGQLDLSSTSIPAILVSTSPSRLEDILTSCLSDSADPKLLLPLCDRRPDNFLKIITILTSKEQEQFGKQLQTLLLSTNCSWEQCYPSLFHPLLSFLSAAGQLTASLSHTEKQLIILETLRVLELVTIQASLCGLEHSALFFILRTMSSPYNNVSQVLEHCTYKMNPWLKLGLEQNNQRTKFHHF